MLESTHLSMPFIAPSQAQKHLTHNEALEILDALVQLSVRDRTLPAPPADLADGDRFIVAGSATGEWVGRDDQIAAWEHGAWVFHRPSEGWQVWCANERVLLVRAGGLWRRLADLFARVGVNATPDDVNRLVVKSEAVLLDHAGAGHQLKINKAGATATASLLYQSNYSGRAEMGLAGDDDWRLKTSADGGTWRTALLARRDGRVELPSAAAAGGFTLDVAGAMRCQSLAQTSDRDRKTVLGPSLGLDFIMRLMPVSFRWKAEAAASDDASPRAGDIPSRPHQGLIAQEVAQTARELGVDFGGYKNTAVREPERPAAHLLDYSEFVAPLVRAVQELASRVAALEGRGDR